MRILADKLRNGETLYTAWTAIPDALTIDAVASSAFDAVTLDMQHGGHDERSVLTSIPAIIRHNKPAVVRIPVGRFDMASRALDFGADGVIAPMVNTIEDAKAFAAAMKYPPIGERSWGPTRSLSAHGEAGGTPYLEAANASTLAIAMIETREAYAITDDILAVDGIDGVFVGPSDFSIAWSGGKVVDPALEDMMPAVAEIAAKAKAAGKFAAIYVNDPGLGARFRKMGYSFVAIGNEGRYIAAGVQGMVDAAKA